MLVCSSATLAAPAAATRRRILKVSPLSHGQACFVIHWHLVNLSSRSSAIKETSTCAQFRTQVKLNARCMAECGRGESLAFSLLVVPKCNTTSLIFYTIVSIWQVGIVLPFFSLCSQPKDPFSLFSRASAVRRRTHRRAEPLIKAACVLYGATLGTERNELPCRSARPHVSFFSLIISGSLARLPLPLVSDTKAVGLLPPSPHVRVHTIFAATTASDYARLRVGHAR